MSTTVEQRTISIEFDPDEAAALTAAIVLDVAHQGEMMGTYSHDIPGLLHIRRSCSRVAAVAAVAEQLGWGAEKAAEASAPDSTWALLITELHQRHEDQLKGRVQPHERTHAYLTAARVIARCYAEVD